VELAQRAEALGFSGVLCPGRGDSLGLCESIILNTRTLSVGTNIVNLFQRSPAEPARPRARSPMSVPSFRATRPWPGMNRRWRL
jgi:alkanesulfonate monooxygenase SsuD/methylene tetrahydromethanopterin reductase-like flavin-dependent oxidoreductase (luciferase family)